MHKTGVSMEKLKLNNMPIRYKLIIHFLLISILPSIGLGLLIGWTVDRIVEEQSTENTMQLIRKVNTAIESDVENLQKITYLISFDPGVQKFLKGRHRLRHSRTPQRAMGNRRNTISANFCRDSPHSAPR